ncbi:MAG: N-acetyltransferase family protein [Thermoleophilia bacterium]
MSDLTIRRAAPGDAAAIGRIYDEGIADGIATFATGPHDARERRAWLAARPERAPVWCGIVEGEVVAWSALAPFSHRPWYDGVGEYTAYVAHGHGGRGIGGRMLDALIAEAPSFGYWKLVGMILSDNTPGLALASAAGFRVVGTHLAHGRQGERWRDVTVVERHLALPGGRAPGAE